MPATTNADKKNIGSKSQPATNAERVLVNNTASELALPVPDAGTALSQDSNTVTLHSQDEAKSNLTHYFPVAKSTQIPELEPVSVVTTQEQLLQIKGMNFKVAPFAHGGSKPSSGLTSYADNPGKLLSGVHKLAILPETNWLNASLTDETPKENSFSPLADLGPSTPTSAPSAPRTPDSQNSLPKATRMLGDRQVIEATHFETHAASTTNIGLNSGTISGSTYTTRAFAIYDMYAIDSGSAGTTNNTVTATTEDVPCKSASNNIAHAMYCVAGNFNTDTQDATLLTQLAVQEDADVDALPMGYNMGGHEAILKLLEFTTPVDNWVLRNSTIPTALLSSTNDTASTDSKSMEQTTDSSTAYTEETPCYTWENSISDTAESDRPALVGLLPDTNSSEKELNLAIASEQPVATNEAANLSQPTIDTYQDIPAPSIDHAFTFNVNASADSLDECAMKLQLLLA